LLLWDSADPLRTVRAAARSAKSSTDCRLSGDKSRPDILSLFVCIALSGNCQTTLSTRVYYRPTVEAFAKGAKLTPLDPLASLALLAFLSFAHEPTSNHAFSAARRWGENFTIGLPKLEMHLSRTTQYVLRQKFVSTIGLITMSCTTAFSGRAVTNTIASATVSGRK